MKKKQQHVLTNEELLELKAMKERRKVSSADVPALNRIYDRMLPGYEICSTCIETIGAEAKSLIAYAEKQIGGTLYNYVDTPDEGDDNENPSTIATKQIVVERECFGENAGKIAKITVNAPIDTPDDSSFNFTEDMIVSVEYIDPPVAAPSAKEIEDFGKLGLESIQASKSNVDQLVERFDVTKMSNAEIVAYVFEKTEIELSENADRDELVESALDLLASFVEEKVQKLVAKDVEIKLEKVELHKNGLNATKGEIVRAYVKQETGKELQQGLKRPALLKAAAEALGGGQ